MVIPVKLLRKTKKVGTDMHFFVVVFVALLYTAKARDTGCHRVSQHLKVGFSRIDSALDLLKHNGSQHTVSSESLRNQLQILKSCRYECTQEASALILDTIDDLNLYQFSNSAEHSSWTIFEDHMEWAYFHMKKFYHRSLQSHLISVLPKNTTILAKSQWKICHNLKRFGGSDNRKVYGHQRRFLSTH